MSERVYLDGVPMRLNSKFYPQPRPQFKEIDIHIPIDALQDDYDFSMERSVLIEVSAWEEQKRLEDERKAEELKRRAEEDEKLRIESEQKRLEEEKLRLEEERIKLEEERQTLEEEECRRLEEERKLVEETERLKIEEDAAKKAGDVERLKTEEEDVKRQDEEDEAVKNVVENEIETAEEKVAETVKEGEAKEKVDDDTQEKVDETEEKSDVKYLHEYLRNSRINVSEFESDTANPFDNVELKSINEMEMLATVLKNNSSSSVPPSHNLEYRTDPHVRNTNYVNGGQSVYGNQGPHQPPQQAASCPYPTQYGMPMPNSYQASQWNTNNSYYVPPSAPDLHGRYSTPNTTAPNSTQMTNQSVNIPTSTGNAFTKYYFPLLSSMADSRSMRDRQNQFSNNLNLNQSYSQPLPRAGVPINATTGSTANQNPYLSSHSPLQPSPIHSSFSHQPSPYYWPNGASMTLHNTDNVSNHSSPTGPLTNDPLHKSNNSHPPSAADLSASTLNGTLHSLR